MSVHVCPNCGYSIEQGRPLPSGSWTAESIGRKRDGWNPHPWVRVAGTQPPEWVRGHRDYSHASASGASGITTTYVLRPGKLYEAEYPVDSSHRRRILLRVNELGDVEQVPPEEAHKWL